VGAHARRATIPEPLGRTQIQVRRCRDAARLPRASSGSSARATQSAPLVELCSQIREPTSLGVRCGRVRHSFGQHRGQLLGLAQQQVHGGVVVQVGVLALDVLQQYRDPVPVVVRREQARPELVRPDEGQGQHLAAEQERRAGVQLGAHRLDERPRAVLAHQPGGAAGGHAADLVCCLDDGRAELVGSPVADVRGHGRPRRPDADGTRAHQPRRSPSQRHSTSPCQRWWSRMYGEVGGTGSSADLKK